MKRLVLLVSLLPVTASLALAQSTTWVPDKAHSEVTFTVLHMGLSNVHGRFGNIGGSIAFDLADITKSEVYVTIDVTTVDTGVNPRDSDLKGGNFFDVANYPKATFVSTGVQKSATGLTVAGNLTLHGVTKPVVLQVDGPTGPVITGVDQKAHSGFSATTTISRLAFGIGNKYPASFVGDEVKLSIDIEAVEQ